MKYSATRWVCRDRTIDFRSGPMLMGILNVTPDSFSDGGRYAGTKTALARALQMAEEGADIIDIGGESTRPGALPVTGEVELERVLPVVEHLKKKAGVLISIDTRKSVVAEAALRAGAHIINDVSALEFDPRMAETARRYKAGIILMHKKGEPQNMQKSPRYDNVVGEVTNYLKERLDFLAGEGIVRETMAIDPGVGFGKTADHNLKLISNIEDLKAIGRPLVIGLSRKNFLGRITGGGVTERLAASLAALAYCLMKGADVMRMHDVKESRDVLKVLNAIYKEKVAC